MGASTVKVATYMNRLLERRWDLEVIKVSIKEDTWEWETFGGMYTFVIIII